MIYTLLFEYSRTCYEYIPTFMDNQPPMGGHLAIPQNSKFYCIIQIICLICMLFIVSEINYHVYDLLFLDFV